MQFDLLHPADQIIMAMRRIYENGMTTTSGGNLSVLDENGDLWITPAGIDKGELTRGDIVCVRSDGQVIGKHRPSSELPFHQLIYRTRSDLKAVVHAHPPALVAFSIVRKIPDIRLLPHEYFVCGRVGMAKYGLTGSVNLAENIAAEFAEGFNAVMLENHGVVVGGAHLFEAYKVFETLDFIARIEINARRIGTPISLSQEELQQFERYDQNSTLESFIPTIYSTGEREIRREMCNLIQRAYRQKLFTSTQGTFSHRLDVNSFIITPNGLDMKYVDVSDLVRIENGKKEAGKIPSRYIKLHQLIYQTQPHVNSIITAHPPNIMAYGVTHKAFDSRIIPESYILLQNVPLLPFGSTFLEPEKTAKSFSKDTPIAIIANDCVIVTGQSLLNVFDRLEVAEFSAKAMISTTCLGNIVPIDEEKIKELHLAFNL